MSSTTQPAPSWQHGKVAGWIVSVDHKRIGALYLGWACVFFVIGAILTVLMRLQMTRPNASILGDSTYKGVLTMHGTLLVFFVLVPVVIGLATYLVPLMIGSSRIAMPGLAAAALWLFAFAGIAVVLSAFASGGSSKDGWTGYPPGTLTQEGNGVRLWLMGLFLLALSVAASAINLAATIRSLRAEGMDWDKTPLFAWSVYVWSVVTIVLAPLAAIGLGLILLERRFDGSFDFFLTSDQSVKPWLVWLFGQSFAYAALVPVVGILAEIVAVFAGRAIASARTLAQAVVGIGGLTLDPRALPRLRGRHRQEAEHRAAAPGCDRDHPVGRRARAAQEDAVGGARPNPLDGADAVRRRRHRPVRDRPALRARARDLREQS